LLAEIARLILKQPEVDARNDKENTELHDDNPGDGPDAEIREVEYDETSVEGAAVAKCGNTNTEDKSFLKGKEVSPADKSADDNDNDGILVEEPAVCSK
jgi:hypothetical protein